ncbi:MAG: hypothetical protein JO104_02765 [Candidatus Eremiobacteraeota bacterium]|nr:hypothetical protein [Candidatus Eremiobacteraeota bacterium]
MSLSHFGRCALGIFAAASMLGACASLAPAEFHAALPPTLPIAGTQQTIRNVIVIIQQERTFDNLFAGFPNADAPIEGLTSTGKYVPLRPITLNRNRPCDTAHPRDGYFHTIYDGGKMDGWNLVDPLHPLCPYTHVERGETLAYWSLAKRFAIADRMFPSTRFGEFANSLYLIAGTARIAPRTYAIGPPSGAPWGCEAPPGTFTPVLKDGRKIPGPFPCFTQFPTIAALLDRANVSWRFYYGFNGPSIWPFNPFEAIHRVRLGKDWTRNMSVPAASFFHDVSKGRLAAVSWILSPTRYSDAPGFDGGPQWISSLVVATEKSRYWDHAAIVIIWELPGNGAFYDDAPPPQRDIVGLGFRVPMIVVSPFAKRDYVSHTDYQFASILKFIEGNWGLGSLGATDKRAHSIADMFESSH